MSDDKLTNKILESGFIEVFFENYQIDRDLILSNEDKLNYALVSSKKDKLKLTKKLIKKTKQNIKEIGHNDLAADILIDFNNYESLIQIFSNYYKRLVNSFTPINDFIEHYDGRCSLQSFYQEFYDTDLMPNIKDINEISKEEYNLIEMIFGYIDDFKINDLWEIDILDLSFYVDYSLEISHLFNLSELFVQITRYLNFKNLLKEVSTKEIINQTDIEFQNLSFSKKLEEFFIQTNYCLVLNPEVLLLSEKGNINLMLEPQHYIKIINDYQIDCPFVIEEKIQELKNLMIKENISVEDGISIFKSYKNYHNAIDGVIIFQPILDLLSKGLKRLNPLITEKEITKEVNSLNNYYESIKKDFHNKLYYGLFEKKSITVTENIEVIDDIKKYKKIPVKYYVL